LIEVQETGGGGDEQMEGNTVEENTTRRNVLIHPNVDVNNFV
jgi:hypothetical protein